MKDDLGNELQTFPVTILWPLQIDRMQDTGIVKLVLQYRARCRMLDKMAEIPEQKRAVPTPDMKNTFIVIIKFQ
jgi:hypothetical protein